MPEANAPDVQQYFDDVVAQQLGGAPITCGFAGPAKGKAIYAARAFRAGEPIWSERAFVAMQHEDNKDFADCCEHCFVSLINSKDAWERVETANTEVTTAAKKEEEATSTAAVSTPATFDDFLAAIDVLQKQGGKSEAESYFSVYRLAAHKVRCTCGVLYCSETCRRAAWNEQHAILCTRSDANESPMGQFFNHTLVTNEIFQLAAKVVARILSRFLASHDLVEARRPVDMFCKQPWWEVVTAEEDLEEGQTVAEYQDCFKGLLAQTLEHFLTGLRDNLARLEKEDALNGLSAESLLASCSEILTLDFFGNIVGMFEMNNISLEIDHPFHTLSEALLETAGIAEADDGGKSGAAVPEALTRVRRALETYATKHKHEHEHENEDTSTGAVAEVETDKQQEHRHLHHHHHHQQQQDQVASPSAAECTECDDCCCTEYEEDFVGVEGTALFSGICTMNHNCDPNCTVIYTKDGTAQVYAVQDISKGEEICISYIDVDQDVTERQQCLREYQFVCHCARCEEERHA